MKNFLKLAFFVVILITLYQANAQTCSGGNCSAASCGTTDVQNCINSTTESNTCSIPSGTCSWTSGVAISGKGINLVGAGAGRVIAVDVETTALTLTTGSKTFSNVTNDMGANAYLNATAPPITTSETLLIYENGFLANFMEGTVTSFSGSTLVMSITSAGGTCGTNPGGNNMISNCKRWLITTLPSTVLTNNLTSGAMITVTEDSSVHTVITGINFAQGSSGGGAGNAISETENTGSGSCYGSHCAIEIHDNFFWSNQQDIIDGASNRSVIWNNSFAMSPFSQGQWAVYRTQDSNNSVLGYSWNAVSYWGSADTNGNQSTYFETNDVHACGNCFDLSDNSRTVIRYNVLDNAGIGSHGADTGWIGMRTAEIYNNAGIFEAYSDSTTAAMPWWANIRGGTFVWFQNTLPQISSTDWGTKSDIALINEPLQRNQGSFQCWGAGFTTSGQYYPRPHQDGFGYINGATTYTYTPLGFSSATTYSNSENFVGTVSLGDSEPAYIWSNSRSQNVGVSDYCSSTLGSYNCGGTSTYCPNTPEPDVSAAYIESGRDYFNGTAKPGYTPYTYPHPLAQSSGQATPSPPVNLKVQTVPN